MSEIVRRGIRQGFGLAPGRVLPAIANLAIVSLGANFLALSELGILAVWLGVIQLVCLGLGGWLDQATLRFLPARRKELAEFLPGHVAITRRTFLAVCLILFVIATYFAMANANSLQISLAFSILGASSWLHLNSQTMLAAVGKPIPYSLSEVGRIVMLATGIATTIFLGSASLESWAWILCGASILALIISSSKSRLLQGLVRTESTEYIGMALKYGLPLAGWLAGAQGIAVIDRFLLRSSHGVETAGIYFANSQFLPAIAMLAQTPLLFSSHARIMEHAATATPPDLRSLTNKFLVAFLVFSVPLALLLSILAPFLTRAILGPDSLAAVSAVPLMMLGNILWGVSMYLHKGLEIQNRTLLLLGIMGVTVLAKFACSALLIPQHVYVGAAIASIIAFAIYGVLVLITRSVLRA